MRFKVMIVEETYRGVGKGCIGTFNMEDEFITRLSWDQVIKACNAEMTGLLTDMLREMYHPEPESEEV